MNKFWGPNVQYGDYSWWYCIGCLKFVRTVELKCSHQKRKRQTERERERDVRGWEWTNWMGRILSQCICLLNHHIAALKYLTILFLNYTSSWKKIVSLKSYFQYISSKMCFFLRKISITLVQVKYVTQNSCEIVLCKSCSSLLFRVAVNKEEPAFWIHLKGSNGIMIGCLCCPSFLHYEKL